MATCPNCHRSSRQHPDLITVEDVLVAKPLGTFSLAGQTMKTVAFRTLRMSCRCGWHIDGYLDGDHFTGDPRTQVFPESPTAAQTPDAPAPEDHEAEAPPASPDS